MEGLCSTSSIFSYLKGRSLVVHYRFIFLLWKFIYLLRKLRETLYKKLQTNADHNLHWINADYHINCDIQLLMMWLMFLMQTIAEILNCECISKESLLFSQLFWAGKQVSSCYPFPGKGREAISKVTESQNISEFRNRNLYFKFH